MDILVKPQWRVNLRPRFTVLEMGEYMAADDGPRETMLRDMKYGRLGRSLIYRNLRPSIIRFFASPTRDRGILAKCRIDLERLSDAASGQQKENFNYELRALDAFERSVNAIEMGAVSQFEFRLSTESGAARSIFHEDFKALSVIVDYAAAILLTNARASMINAWISHTSRHSRRLPDRWSAA